MMAHGSDGACPTDRLVIIFDGECPFCSRYVELTALGARGIEVELVDARNSALLNRFSAVGDYDLDVGMLVGWQGKWFHGAAAIELISRLINSPLSSALATPFIARVTYPFFRLFRRAALLTKGVAPLKRSPAAEPAPDDSQCDDGAVGAAPPAPLPFHQEGTHHERQP